MNNTQAAGGSRTSGGRNPLSGAAGGLSSRVWGIFLPSQSAQDQVYLEFHINLGPLKKHEKYQRFHCFIFLLMALCIKKNTASVATETRYHENTQTNHKFKYENETKLKDRICSNWNSAVMMSRGPALVGRKIPFWLAHLYPGTDLQPRMRSSNQ